MQGNELWSALYVMRGAPGEDVLRSLALGIGQRPHDVTIPAMETKQLACNQMHNMQVLVALFIPETSIIIQKRRPHNGYLNSETPGDSKNAFLHCGDVSGCSEWRVSADKDHEGPLHKLMPDKACIIDHQLDAQAIQSVIRLCRVLCLKYCALCCALRKQQYTLVTVSPRNTCQREIEPQALESSSTLSM